MEDEIQNQKIEETSVEPTKRDYLLPASILISAIIIAGAWVYTAGIKVQNTPRKTNNSSLSSNIQKPELEEKVLPSEGAVLPISLG